ncbi:YfcC family protein [Oceanispirochaeta crateris]|uniref:YfcC family protein n=1 Tax=Oceanispirochaeta crateris TaxID=2518645 RepID=A0A5C1QRE0_9SPIO|nr:Na+/H+ antiporter NhaC family protein [Oceanispirochaeta crateris]QEN09779.1 YfcC family protein [Oceanispirochaeta crateris]
MSTKSKDDSMLKIGLKPFLTAFGILFILIVVSGFLTRWIPAGNYQRILEDGRLKVVADSFEYVNSGVYPLWRWFTAPIEVIWGDNWLMVLVLSLFMIFLGASFTVLEKGGVMQELLSGTVRRFQNRKYTFMAILIFVMMFLAAFVGVYEGLVPLIVIIVPLSLALGWDSLTGLGMSLLALSFGFAAAVTNPFTIAVAQKLSGLPLFSGAWFRIIFFIAVYLICFFSVRAYAKKIEKNPEKSAVYEADKALKERFSNENVLQAGDEASPAKVKAAVFFGVCLGIAILFMILAGLIPALPSDAAFPTVALLFLIGGTGAGIIVGYMGMELLKILISGAMNMLPGIVLILMAMSVPHIMTRGLVMDTILYHASELISGTNPFMAAFYIYVLTLFLNFFISSASAKAFLVMPIIAPLADLVGLTRQTAVLAFDLGDGFSNMIFPTNALLLIGLSFTVVSYPQWMKWTWKMQLAIAGISMVFLMIAVAMGFGPF